MERTIPIHLRSLPLSYVVLAFLLMVSAAQGQSPVLLHDVTKETGIDFQHTDGSTGKRYLVEYISAGLALFDYNGDGWTDIYFLNGAPLGGAKATVPPKNVLYRNDGNWVFTDVTEEAGVGDTGFGLGVTAADFDNDGDQDLYLNNFGPNVLYRNNGDGTFTDVTARAGVANGNRVGAGTCFLDADCDGDLDLYVSNYVKFSFDQPVAHTSFGLPVYPSPLDYEADPDSLFRNEGDGSFTDVSQSSGIGLHPGTGMGIVCGDFDRDDDTDIFVCNDVMSNFYFENDGRGHFEEVALMVGVAYDFSGIQQGSMGADCGDYDNDGLLDLFMTNYQDELPVLYRNTELGFFEDVTISSGAGTSAARNVTWGNGFVDFDNDGDRDLYIACGHVQDNIAERDDTLTYEAPNILLMNTGDGKFIDVSDQSGDGMKPRLVSRGTGFDDLDNDGDIDVVVLNSRSRPMILRNDSQNENHWFQIRLEGTKTNRDGVGARVTVKAGELELVDEVHSGRGYQSHHGMQLHFGLGQNDRVDRVEVRWIGGVTEIFDGTTANRRVTLKEGTGNPALKR